MFVPPADINTVEKLFEIDVETIKKILSLEKKFTDFIFEPSTWFDGFIVELLRWFDNKINEISDNDNEFDQWKTYYVQIVKILYHFVVYDGLYDYDDLVKLVFKYLFYSSCEIYLNPYENDYNFISPDALDALDVAELYTKEYNNQQMELFNNHKIYVNINGSYGLPRKDDITQSIKNKIQRT